MAYLLFIVYFLVFSWLITKSTFIRKSGIGKPWLLALFTIKLVSGVLYGYIYSRPGFIQGSDTWQIYFESVKESRMLVQDPARFFTGLFANPDQLSYTGFSNSHTSYWNNLKDNLLIKFQAIMNLFSGGYYYINVVIYSFVTFFGSIAFYRTMDQLYPGRVIVKEIAAFLIPSFLFWTSGLYKDGFIFLFMALLIYHLQNLSRGHQGRWKGICAVAISLIVIFLLRNYVAFLLIPAIGAWVISTVLPRKSLLVFTTIYASMALFVIFSGRISPRLDIPRIIAAGQTAFLALPANSAIPAKKLEPSSTGLLKNGVQAIRLGFFSPYLWENKGILYLPFALEVVACFLLVLLFLFYREYSTPKQDRFMYFCFFLAGTAWLLLGYTVNILGALVRYKSIFFPLVAGPLLCSISWEKLKHIIKKDNLPR